MCKFLKDLTTSDIVDIITALISAFSAYLLYKTFVNQKESSKLQSENILLDKKIKEGENLPIIDSLKFNYEGPIDNFESIDFGLNCTFTITFIVKNNTMKIIKTFEKIYIREFENVEDIHFKEIENTHFNKLLIPNNKVKIEVAEDPMKVFKTSHTNRQNDIEKIYYEKYDFITIEFKFIVQDMIGNNYDLIIKGGHNISTEIIEYKKTDDK